jgi:hypothetical protein
LSVRRLAGAIAAAVLLAACTTGRPATSATTTSPTTTPPSTTPATTTPATTTPATTTPATTTTTPSPPLPRVVTTSTPSGWVPVAFGKLQVSVPGNWLLETPSQSVCAQAAGGMVFLGEGAGLPPPTGCVLTPDRVALAALGNAAPHGTIEQVNGVAVVQLRRTSDQVVVAVPSLGVQVIATGSTAAQILSTISPSPLAVVDAEGPAPAVPAGWRWTTFGPLRLATPAGWAVRRSGWPWCGTGPEGGTVWLGDFATSSSVLYPPCAPPPATALGEEAQDGVLVATGPFEPLAKKATAQCFPDPGLEVCATVMGSTEVGVAVATSGGAHAYLEIGLAGDGTVARTILYSLRPA